MKHAQKQTNKQKKPSVSSAPSFAGHSLRSMMTPPQSYSDWQTWTPPSRGGVASAGGSHHCPATIPFPPWGLSDHGVLSVPGAFLTRPLGSPVSPDLAQLFSLEEAPVSKFGGAGGGFSSDLSVAVSGGDCLPSRGAQVEGSMQKSESLKQAFS